MSNFVEDLQRRANGTLGHILVCSPESLIYVEAGTVITMENRQRPERLKVLGKDHQVVMGRMAALMNLLEIQSSYDQEGHYCAVVTDWPERAQEIVEFVAETLEQPVIPMLLAPADVDAAFDFAPLFSKTVIPVAGNTIPDGGHRQLTSAKIIGLHDRTRNRTQTRT